MTINLLTVVEILLLLDLFRCIPSFESGTLETGWNGYILIEQPEKGSIFFPHFLYKFLRRNKINSQKVAINEERNFTEGVSKKLYLSNGLFLWGMQCAKRSHFVTADLSNQPRSRLLIRSNFPREQTLPLPRHQAG